MSELSFFNFYFKEFSWQQCEERFSHKNSLLAKLVEKLYLTNQNNEAFSVLKRHNNLFAGNLVSNDILKDFEEKKDKFQMVPNKLIDIQKFAPFEVTYDDADEKDFITLKDYGINEADVIFVNDKNLIQSESIEYLLNSKIVK